MAFTLPYGYQAALISQVSRESDLSSFLVQEEGLPEGLRLLCCLLFQDRLSPEVVALFNQRCKEKGITPWPENQDIVFADPDEPALYLCWQKGSPYWGVILAILASLVLPPLLLAGLWLILPEPVKQMLETVMWLMVMGLVMWGMTKITRAITAGGDK